MARVPLHGRILRRRVMHDVVPAPRSRALSALETQPSIMRLFPMRSSFDGSRTV
jgi:hypothetical protein